VGVESTYITYNYKVQGTTYEETTSISIFRRMGECNIIGQKFKVYYSEKNPEKSIIDLDEEIE